MPTLAEIGFSIRNQAKGYFSSDDERIDIELIYKMVHQIRATLIKNLLREKRTIDNNFYQEICCLEVQCRNITCAGVDSGEVEYYVDAPSLEDLGGHEVIYFGTADKRTEFSSRNYMGKLYGNYSAWTGNKPYYTIVGTEFKIGNIPTTGLKYVCLIGILSNPFEGKCYSLTENDPYPVPNHIVHELELIAIKQLMSTLNVPPDVKNNSQENPRIDNVIR
jgi:hypothetical protein